MHEMIIFNLV